MHQVDSQIDSTHEMRERRHSKISGMDELGGPGAMEEFGGNVPVRNIPYISSNVKDGWTFYCSHQ